MNKHLAAFVFFPAVFVFVSLAAADVLVLKNGRSIEGIIREENNASVRLDIGFGTIGFRRDEIESIEKSDKEGLSQLRQKWGEERRRKEEENLRQKLEAEAKKANEAQQEQRVELKDESGHIFVDAVLNGKVKAHLLMDTGATFMVLSKPVGKKLGISADKIKDSVELELGDGRKIKADFVMLESVSVQGAQAKDVEAAVLLDDDRSSFAEGVLGMSFLNRFNFKVDQSRKQLILEKAK